MARSACRSAAFSCVARLKKPMLARIKQRPSSFSRYEVHARSTDRGRRVKRGRAHGLFSPTVARANLWSAAATRDIEERFSGSRTTLGRGGRPSVSPQRILFLVSL